jgi:phage terminase small subunit
MAQPNGKPDCKPVSLESRQRMSRAKLSIKQQRFVEQYVSLGNATQAARMAGYKPKAARQMASENLSKPAIDLAVKAELARVALEITPDRVQRRLDTISHNAEAAGQFGPAVRAEELLGKSIGMWIDRSLQLTGQLNDAHLQALLEVARRRQAEPVDLADDRTDT